jgi:hypothetical protein
MSTGSRILLANALDIAANVVAVLGPHCLKIDIAGIVRRQPPTIGDLVEPADREFRRPDV